MTTAAPLIERLWAGLQRTPAAGLLWHQLAEVYAEAGLLPQQAYALQQQRRLAPSAVAPEAGTIQPAPGSPRTSAAEALLLQPQSPAAQD